MKRGGWPGPQSPFLVIVGVVGWVVWSMREGRRVALNYQNQTRKCFEIKAIFFLVTKNSD